ncbi:hypothetical protein [Actinomyces vulturis]|uniref:hypothetical protein n=1 Tax=Actinomyces vulturis TaxID=1857645 RepID=UPI00159EC08E|nr:hypothetical protein [Actinomyces vulturis]
MDHSILPHHHCLKSYLRFQSHIKIRVQMNTVAAIGNGRLEEKNQDDFRGYSVTEFTHDVSPFTALALGGDVYFGSH